MSLKHLPASVTGDDVAKVVDRDGAVIVDQLLSPQAMDQVMEEIQPWIEATPFGSDESAGRRTRRTGGLVARSPRCRELISNPLVLSAIGKVLHRATSYQLHLTQVITLSPGEIVQAIHRDQWGFDFFPFPKGYEVQCNTIWAATDFTAENGATRVIPASHRYEDHLQFTESDTEPAQMPKGSVLFYTGSFYHGAGANRSTATRCGINITYSVSWLRQEENQYLTVPVETARTLPTDLLRLIGYSRGAFGLGYVDDLRDPIELVRPEEARRGFGDFEALQKRLENIMTPASKSE
jgi:ectoine hydroxylase-related dioxygenase (phytanoyl-CoA dioxygenase family)